MSFITSDRPSARTEELDFQQADFREILYWKFLVKRNGEK
jgi:hypothetical protein